jgi:hypothetical protein
LLKAQPKKNVGSQCHLQLLYWTIYKQWFTLADFFAKLGHFAGFSLRIYIIYNARGISAAIRELYCTVADFLQNWNFPLHNINFAERNSEAAMGRVGSRGHYIF